MPGAKKPLFASFTRNVEIKIEFLPPSVSYIIQEAHAVGEGCFYPTGLFKSSFLSVAFFHSYMNSSMPPPQRYRVKGIIQEPSKAFFFFF